MCFLAFSCIKLPTDIVLKRFSQYLVLQWNLYYADTFGTVRLIEGVRLIDVC